ncbi:MAG: aspartate-semialdehyde dehydrogenase [Acidobacteriota bacterium]
MRRQDKRAPGTARIPVAVLGATGMVGQRFVSLLAEHAWFSLASVAASDRSAGRRYADIVRWRQARPLPVAAADAMVEPCTPDGKPALVFSALDGEVAGPIETAFAAAGHLVISNAKSHRLAPSVPLIIPEVNPDHLGVLDAAAEGAGAIITNPNCSSIGLVMALAPLAARFGLRAVQVTTLQAISGAGLPGVPGLEIADNVIPRIEGEEEKLEAEPLKILGELTDGRIEPAEFPISAQCNRVGVVDGHTACVSVRLARPATVDDLRTTWTTFQADAGVRNLPSAPRCPVHVIDDEDGPQPRLHRDLDGGMACSVGRVRPCPVQDFKFVTVSHNTVRGAAGGALLVGELAVARGYLPGVAPPGVARTGGR